MSLGGVRNPIGRRTESNQTANGIRLQTTNIHRLNEAIIKMLNVGNILFICNLFTIFAYYLI